MDATCCGIDVFHVAVNIGRSDLVPLSVFLHQFKQMRKLWAILVAPLLQHDHSGVVCRLTVTLRCFKNRQSQVFKKVGLESIRAAVTSDIHVPDHECDFAADTLHLSVCLGFTLLHQRKIHRHSVIFHDAKIYSGRTFHLLHQCSVLRKIGVKPVVENVVQTECKIRICTAVTDGFFFHRVKLIKVLSIRNRAK